MRIDKCAEINSKTREFRIKQFPAGEFVGPVDFALSVLEKKTRQNPLCFGIGPLAGSKLPGTHRLTFVAFSPLWKGIAVSTMGGAALPLYRTGLSFVSIEGKPKKYYVLGIRGVNGKIKHKFHRLSEEELKSIYFEGYAGKRGVWALQSFVRDEMKYFFDNNQFRILVAGPAALYTNMGCIMSTVMLGERFRWGSDDVAGRGGLGTVMLAGHGVPAIAYGGDYDGREFAEDLRAKESIDALFKKKYGKTAAKAWLEKGRKYLFVPELKTGGTYGVNFSKLGTSLLSFNWVSTGLPFGLRQKIYDDLVKQVYLKQFNDTVIKNRTWYTCGEFCPLACKKVKVMKKKDYEPYGTCGPICGIFDMNHAEAVVHLADTYGFDALEIGQLSAWVLECVHAGLLNEADFDLKFDVCFDPEKFLKNPSDYSFKHSLFVCSLINMIIQCSGVGETLSFGVRAAAKELDTKYEDRVRKAKTSFSDLACFIAGTGDAYISPAPYWVPGVFAPLPFPVLSKTYYKGDEFDPETIGRKCAERFEIEVGTDNFGVCRFHRGWTEPFYDELLYYSLGKRDDYKAHCHEMIKKMIKLNKKNGLRPQPFQTRRVKVVIRNFLREMSSLAPKNKQLAGWVKKFEKNLGAASKEYYELMKKGIEKHYDIRL